MSAKFGGRTGVILTDHALGASVYGIADADSGASSLIKNYHATSPWGESPADTGITFRLRMAGQQYDQTTGLYYMRARFYDPSLGRFLSEDPAGLAGGTNLYAYAGNDPINGSDPTGLSPDCGPFGKWIADDPSKPNGPGRCNPYELTPINIFSSVPVPAMSVPTFNGPPGYAGPIGFPALPGGEGVASGGGGAGGASDGIGHAPSPACKAALTDAAVSVALDALTLGTGKMVEKTAQVAYTAWARAEIHSAAGLYSTLGRTEYAASRLARGAEARWEYRASAVGIANIGAQARAVVNMLNDMSPAAIAETVVGMIPVVGSIYSIGKAAVACLK